VKGVEGGGGEEKIIRYGIKGPGFPIVLRYKGLIPISIQRKASGQ
jgi:hypothetical protein